MGDMADMTFDGDGYWPFEDEREDEGSYKKHIPDRKLRKFLRSKRRHRKKEIRMQKFTDEDFFVAVGRDALEWEHHAMEQRRLSKPSWISRFLPERW